MTADLLSILPLVAQDEDLPLVREAWRRLLGTAPEFRAAATVSDLSAVVRLEIAGAGWSVLRRTGALAGDPF